MSDSLHIAFLAAEALPYVKAGGLGDVAGALPRELARRGHRVDLFLPLYRDIDRTGLELTSIGAGRVPFMGGKNRFRILAHEAAPGLRTLLIDAPTYFDRPGLYTDPDTGLAFPDDGERYLFFTLASLETLADLSEPVDLLHCNDYHCALAPALLERHYRRKTALADTATVFSIHNLAYQGNFDRKLLKQTGVPATEAGPGTAFEFWGKLNFMKAGIVGADLVATVSPSYAREIASDPEQGCGMEGLLAGRGADLVGILNGIDPEAWNPAADPHIVAPIDPSRPGPGKAANRRALLAEAGFDPKGDRALIGVVSRLVSQKGFDLLPPVIDEILDLPLQLAILGTGEKSIEALYAEFAKRYPDHIKLWIKYDNGLAHRIEAGADFFLMPSLYEPCGLNQLYSLRYGTLPIVRRTGGLADTVIDIDADPARGNGISFADYEPSALLAALRRALLLYEDEEAIAALRRRAMASDHSWGRAAGDYETLYSAARARRHGDDAVAGRLLASLGAGDPNAVGGA